MSPRCRSCSPVPTELRAAAGLLERRWTMATIYACSSGAARFNEFRQSLPGVSPTTLSERLEQLEAAGIVDAPPHRRPPASHRVHADPARGAASRGGRRAAAALSQAGAGEGRLRRAPSLGA